MPDQSPMTQALYNALLAKARQQTQPPKWQPPYIQRAINRVKESGTAIPTNVNISTVDKTDFQRSGNPRGSFFVDEDNNRQVRLNPVDAMLDNPVTIEQVLVHELAHAKQAEGLSYRQVLERLGKEYPLAYDDRPSEQEAWTVGDNYHKSVPPDRITWENNLARDRAKYKVDVGNDLWDILLAYREDQLRKWK